MELGKMNPSELDGVLGVLRENGVKEFQCESFHVKFFVDATPMVEESISPRDKEEAPKSVWHDPKLWPDGKPPSFPGKDK